MKTEKQEMERLANLDEVDIAACRFAFFVLRRTHELRALSDEAIAERVASEFAEHLQYEHVRAVNELRERLLLVLLPEAPKVCN